MSTTLYVYIRQYTYEKQEETKMNENENERMDEMEYEQNNTTLNPWFVSKQDKADTDKIRRLLF